MKITEMVWLRRNGRPLLVFVLYFVSIASFGGVYRWLYYRNTANFWFNEDIYKSQYTAANVLYEAEHKAQEREVALIANKLTAIDTLYSEFRKGLLSVSVGRLETTATSPSGYRVRIREEVPSGGPGLAPVAYEISIFQSTDKPLPADELIGEQPNTAEIVGTSLLALQDRYRRLLAEHTATLNVMIAARGPTRIWSYWDFFYFSMMTQTTVAFGDMLPNTTAVRMVVCLQVFLGCLLLIVIINWYFPSKGDLLRRE
jgi:hypothetical protein